MCGLAGLWRPGGQSDEAARELIHRMTGVLEHRGPDADGHWLDDTVGVALGHRRLSIVDLSSAGHQPMVSASGRYVTVFNGEIYNHDTLRTQLQVEGHTPEWRGHSDTETLLAAIEAWGLPEALKRSSGMFALAVWDREERRLSLARDRLGEKPLYYGAEGGAFVWASELKAIRCVPGFAQSLDVSSLASYLRYGYVPDPQTIYSGVRKLRPGHYLQVRDGSPGREQAYWSLDEVIADGVAHPLKGDEATVCATVEDVLARAVKSQMLSDVPLGSFLSGGIDSSLVTALMQRQSTTSVRTYSIGFAEDRFNEAPFAKAVAQHLGTEHTEFLVSEGDALEVIPQLPSIYDEPFADSSQIPTVLLSRLARSDITVALTGDGGDEVFGGYTRHTFAPKVWRRLSSVPFAARKVLAAGAVPLARLAARDDSAVRRVARHLGAPLTLFDKLGSLGPAMGQVRSIEDLYIELTSLNRDPQKFLATRGPEAAPPEIRGTPDNIGAAFWMMAKDTVGYLPGDILTKVDRAAMSASLETRTPFLDSEVVALAWRLPAEARISGGTGKRVLRSILGKYVPDDLINRPKQGFSIPLDRWLRGELREWAEAHLAERRISEFGVLDAVPVRALWANHLSRRENHGQKLWTILMLQAWLGENPLGPAHRPGRA